MKEALTVELAIKQWNEHRSECQTKLVRPNGYEVLEGKNGSNSPHALGWWVVECALVALKSESVAAAYSSLLFHGGTRVGWLELAEREAIRLRQEVQKVLDGPEYAMRLNKPKEFETV